MKQWEKEIKQAQLDREKEVYKELEQAYRQALKDVQDKSKKLQSQIDKLVEADPDNESLIRSKVYQLNYQNTIKQQLDDAMNRLSKADTITAYMEDMYKEGYISQFYALQKQGVPVLAPINHEKMLTALTYNTANIPLSTRLYNNVDKAKKQILSEITRGIASGMSGQDVARNIQNRMGVSYRKARQLAQNEGHRVNTQAVMDGMHTAKERGADIVKQWDCTYDKKTRPEHRELDQKWVEVDDYFKWSGGEVFAPKEFGVARLDINCRCALLSVPRWDVEDGVKKHYDNLKGELIDAKNYDDWKEKYYNVSEKYEDVSSATKSIRNYDSNVAKMYGKHYDALRDLLDKTPEPYKSVYEQFIDDIVIVNKSGSGAYFSSLKNEVHLNISVDVTETELKHAFNTFFHEAGHNIDFLLGNRDTRVYYSQLYKDGIFRKTIINEVDEWVESVNTRLKNEFKAHSYDYEWLYRNKYISDSGWENLVMLAKNYGFDSVTDMASKIKNGMFDDYSVNYVIKQIVPQKYSKKYAYKSIENEIRSLTDWEKQDLSDILEGATKGKIQAGWGHGKSYWAKGDMLSKEAFTEMLSAYASNPESLRTLKKYLPNSVKIFDEMIKGALL